MLIESFIKYIRYELNYSTYTVLSYNNDLRQFETFVVKEGGSSFDVKGVTAMQIRAWVVDLMEHKVTARTVKRKLQALRAFYKFLLQRKKVSENPALDVEIAKTPKRLPDCVRQDNVESLFEGNFDETDFESVRDRLILLMFYSTGMRRSELIELLDENVANGELKVRGKRNKDRIIPFGDDLQHAIDEYCKLRNEVIPMGRTKYFFIRKNGEPLYPSLVYRLVHDRLSEVGGGNRYSPHVLRHTFASALLNNGAKLNAVKELLGHESLAATQVYTHITYGELKSNYEHAHPRALKKEDDMEVRIKSIHFDASEKLEGFVNKKLEKLARRNEEITLAEVTLKVVKPETAMNKEAGIQLVIPTKMDLFASKVADTFEEAVDLAIEALERQLEKTKKDK